MNMSDFDKGMKKFEKQVKQDALSEMGREAKKKAKRASQIICPICSSSKAIVSVKNFPKRLTSKRRHRETGEFEYEINTSCDHPEHIKVIQDYLA